MPLPIGLFVERDEVLILHANKNTRELVVE